MGLIQSIINYYKDEKRKKNDLCNNYIEKINYALSEYLTKFSDLNQFVEPEEAVKWNEKHQNLIKSVERKNILFLWKTVNYQMLLQKQKDLYECSVLFKQKISEHNEKVAKGKVDNAYNLIGNVEGRRLDLQQMSCIVKEVRNHLVIAGAGTGKTTTVVGKIKYLLKTGKYKSEDILVLSFTNASACEMSERIEKETGEKIAAHTFHKLGKEIILKVEGRNPDITSIDMWKFVDEQIKFNMKNKEYLKKLSLYMLYNRVMAKSEFDFNTQEEYDEYLKMNPPTTFNREVVKSYGEMEIANFLFQNGINYIYENPYKIDTSTNEFNQYKPDFYLPDYDVYIEYYGINKEGKVPDYFKGKNGMSGNQAYKESMLWKRELHKANGTSLIECYAYEKMNGNLMEKLSEKLKNNSVILNPKSPEELWEIISKEDHSVLGGLVELFVTLINLIKSNDYKIADVREINRGNSNAKTNEMILYLIEPIFNKYVEYLENKNEIDFNDMINKSAKYIREKKYINPYKYVIVDEYQDISKSRFVLLKELRKSNDYGLFCVGDDWQSIYRFTGSDTGFILNFEKYWGASEISKIETTYRFSQSLIDVSGKFVMKNPAQIKKSMKGRRDENTFALDEISDFREKNVIDAMVEDFDDLPKNSKVFLIGRYSFDIDLLKYNNLLSYKYDKDSTLYKIAYNKRKDLKIEFLTAHKSKGLQADYVYIINNKNSRMGFPSKIQDAPILELLLDNSEQYSYAEERRLFYVALTRAKQKAKILTIINKESEFVIELRNDYSDELKNERGICPECGGRMIKKNGPYGAFYGCSNYRINGCKYKKKIVEQ